MPNSPMSPWTFHSAGSLVFGRGSVSQLGAVAGRLRAKRVFVVTDTTLAAAGVLDPVREPLIAAGVAVGVFDGGKPEPAIEVVRAAADAARAYRPDAVLGLGG